MPPTVFLLGPNRWPSNTADKEAGLKIRRDVVAENADCDVNWIIMEDDKGGPKGEAEHAKFLRLAKASTHVFVIWPEDAKMAGTLDEIVLIMALEELTKNAPEITLFHQRGVLETRVEGQGEDAHHVLHSNDVQGRSPYLRRLVDLEPFLVEWSDADHLKHQVRETLLAGVGVQPKTKKGGVSLSMKKRPTA